MGKNKKMELETALYTLYNVPERELHHVATQLPHHVISEIYRKMGVLREIWKLGIGKWGEKVVIPVASPPKTDKLDYYTVSELSKLLNISTITLYKEIHTGKIPAIKVGGQFRIPKHIFH